MTTKNKPTLSKSQKLDLFDQQLINEFEAYCSESKKSWNVVAGEINLSPAVVSTWRNKTYNGDVEKINYIIRRYLKLQGVTPTADLQYVEIHNNRIITAALETCEADNLIVAITGDTGTSKTVSIREFAKNNDVIKVSSNGTYRLPIEYMRELHAHRLIGGDGLGSLNKLSREIIEEAKRKNIVIVVDQADYLTLRIIDIFRTLNDEAGTGIAFIGLPTFQSLLSTSNEPQIKQIRDRIKFNVALKAYTLKECEFIMTKNLSGCNGFAEDFYAQSMGSLRILSSIVYNVKKEMYKGKELDKALIVRSASYLIRRAVV